MKWFDKDSTEEEIITECKKHMGVVLKRTQHVMVRLVPPLARALSFQETKLMRENFGDDYSWTDVDSLGNIILLDKKDGHKDIGMFYVHIDDLKIVLEQRRKRL